MGCLPPFSTGDSDFAGPSTVSTNSMATGMIILREVYGVYPLNPPLVDHFPKGKLGLAEGITSDKKIPKFRHFAHRYIRRFKCFFFFFYIHFFFFFC